MKTLRELHREHKPLVSPLAHDALSARLIERAGFKTFNIGGSAMLAARHALPDLGLAGFAEMHRPSPASWMPTMDMVM